MNCVINKILIANRGEIACRIIKTCRSMGILTVAIYADADKQALHVAMADEAVYLGATLQESYLDKDKIIAVAQKTASEAVHPGYGFLSENADFAKSCERAGLICIGPPAAVIALMGDKRNCKCKLGDFPLIPGYHEQEQSDQCLAAAAEQLGYPIMVKAAAGGGGKGMRMVNCPEELLDALHATRNESLQAFADDTLILEKALLNPRHIEVQIFADTYGNIVALGERECSIQRRYQKIIEETPCPGLTTTLREKICSTAVDIAHRLQYINAGTIEFLLASNQEFYFLEMNTRLQVEHPVTELVTGLDLVQWQILVAEGYPLPQQSISLSGHAIECRVYAEDPDNNFLPANGRVIEWQAPETVRVDSGIRSGDQITIHYDPLLAKIIAHAPDRQQAIRKLHYALKKTILLGITNNLAFLCRILQHPQYLAENLCTDFINIHSQLFTQGNHLPATVLIAVACCRYSGEYWRNNPGIYIQQCFQYQNQEYKVKLTPQSIKGYQVQIEDQIYQAQILHYDNREMTIVIDNVCRRLKIIFTYNDMIWVHSLDGTYSLRWLSPFPDIGEELASNSLRAPMPGEITKIMVKVGDVVPQGSTLVILKAMKMEHRIQAPYTGQVTEIFYHPGQIVSNDARLMRIMAT